MGLLDSHMCPQRADFRFSGSKATFSAAKQGSDFGE